MSGNATPVDSAVLLSNPRSGRKVAICLEDEGIPHWLAKPLLRAYNEDCQRVSYDTGRERVHQIRKLSAFVVETGLAKDPRSWPVDFLQRYASWLRQQKTQTEEPYRNASMSGFFGAIKGLLKIGRRLSPEHFGHLDLPNCVFKGKQGVGKVSMSSSTLLEILDAAYKEAEEVWEQFGELLQRGANDDDLRRFVSPDRIYPFYLCLLISTAGNPGPITQIQTDCLRETEAAALIEIEWFKPRAGGTERIRSKRAQKISPETIVKRMLDLTSRLRPIAGTHASQKLFVFHQQGGGGKGFAGLHVRILTMGYTGALRLRFVARNSLGSFIERDIRTVVLAAHEALNKGRSLVATQRVANHSDPKLTHDYVRRSKDHDDEMAKRLAEVMPTFAGKFVEETGQGSQANTALGLRCSDLEKNRPDPDDESNPSPGSCLAYLRCFTCRHATIPTRDWETAARLMSAVKAFDAAFPRVSTERWLKVLEPLRKFVQDELLPKFPIAVRERAAERVGDFPTLEIW